MNVPWLKEFLLWSIAVNAAFLFVWWLFIVLVRDLVYRIHTGWFRLAESQFDAIHYGGMMAYKAAIFFFLVAPWIVLHLVE